MGIDVATAVFHVGGGPILEALVLRQGPCCEPFGSTKPNIEQGAELDEEKFLGVEKTWRFPVGTFFFLTF